MFNDLTVITYFCELQKPLSCHLVAAGYLLFFLQLAVQCGKTSPQLTRSLHITHMYRGRWMGSLGRRVMQEWMVGGGRRLRRGPMNEV